jgi:hypothetical protein
MHSLTKICNFIYTGKSGKGIACSEGEVRVHILITDSTCLSSAMELLKSADLSAIARTWGEVKKDMPIHAPKFYMA